MNKPAENVNRKQKVRSNLKVIKRSNTVLQALNLPTICNVNPRSVYNKIDELCNFIEEESVNLIFISESWERPNQTLQDLIKIDDFEVISNVC